MILDLSVSMQDGSKSYERIFMKFFWSGLAWTKKKASGFFFGKPHPGFFSMKR